MRADAQLSFLPVPETIEVEYRYGQASPRKIRIHKVDVYDARQLNVSAYDWILNEYKDLSTPSYAMNSRPPQLNFRELFDEQVGIYVRQLKHSAPDCPGTPLPVNPLHKELILKAHEFAGERKTEEVSSPRLLFVFGLIIYSKSWFGRPSSCGQMNGPNHTMGPLIHSAGRVRIVQTG